MSFPFRTAKATEVAAAFLRRSGGSINIMKLVKLIYLLDRRSIAQRGTPVVGGWYVSMKNGPVTSEVLKLINKRRLVGEDDATWEQHIGARERHTITLSKPIKQWEVSDAEVTMIDAVWQEHGAKDQWQLRDWCHDHCKEWANIKAGYEPISLLRLTNALGKSKDEFISIAQEADEMELLDRIFS